MPGLQYRTDCRSLLTVCRIAFGQRASPVSVMPNSGCPAIRQACHGRRVMAGDAEEVVERRKLHAFK